jgi:hypothetical protein
MININNQSQQCHSERSEESLWACEILSGAKNDSTIPILVVNIYYEPGAGKPDKETRAGASPARTLYEDPFYRSVVSCCVARYGRGSPPPW